MRRILSAVLLFVLIHPRVTLGQSARGAVESHPVDSIVTLDQLIVQALGNNPGLQASKVRIRSAEARIPQATAWDDPQAGVEFMGTPLTSANPFRDGMETDYYVQQMIPLFGKKSLMGEAARANVDMVEQQSAGLERNLVADVKRAYAMLYAAQRRLDVNAENQRLLNQIVESARGKYSVGIASQSDVLKAQVELVRLENERSLIEEELRSAEAMMNALRAAPPATRFPRVADIDVRPLSVTLEELQQRAWDHRPEILAMHSEIAMNRAEASAWRRELLPDLMLQGSYKQMKEGKDMWGAMVGITIPVAPWASGKYSGRAEESELNIRSGELSLADMKNMAAGEVRDAWWRTRSRLEQLQRYREAILPQAEQTLQSTLVAYQTDRADFLSLLDSYRMIQMFRMEYYMLVGEYLTAFASLERAVGTGIE